MPDRGVYHMFYAGTVNEVIYHARSADLIRWHKDSPLKPLVVPDPRWYTPHTVCPEDGRAWRDPFLFRDPAGDRHWLLVTARLREGAPTERGCVGLAVSEDLEHWEVKPPLYAPHICNAPEVCELFAMDGRYYLFFSHGETFTCRYRVAERWDGPYRRPPDDLLLPHWTADANRHRRLHHRAGPGRVPHVLRRHGQRGNTSGATPAITSGSSRA